MRWKIGEDKKKSHSFLLNLPQECEGETTFVLSPPHLSNGGTLALWRLLLAPFAGAFFQAIQRGGNCVKKNVPNF